MDLVPVEFVADEVIPSGALANVEASLSRGLPRFHAMRGLGKAAGPVAIVGGGPSLGDCSELRTFDGTIISCGTVHDHLQCNGVVPDYHVDSEPDADGVMTRWLQFPDPYTIYLIASQCPPATFDALRRHTIVLWHCAATNDPSDGPDFRGEPAIPGGCCNLLRAWPLAAVMGFKDIHFFGFDCSFPESCASQHAYAYDWTLDEVCTAISGGKRFYTTLIWLNQMDVFVKMYRQAQGKFAITVHGDGLVASAMSVGGR